jgi:transcriptional regulator with XRE-family HTH domain
MEERRLANNIRRFRLEQRPRWSQSDLAARLGLSQQEVSAYEAGTRIPSLRTAFALASAFGRSVEELFFALHACSWEPLRDAGPPGAE